MVRIESTQNQFLLFILRGFYPNPFIYIPPYRTKLLELNLPTLKSSRTMSNVTFLIYLIIGSICLELLLNNSYFNVPHRPKNYYQPLKIRYFQQNYANVESFRQICVNFNDLYNTIDTTLYGNTICRFDRFLKLNKSLK